jgi:hypothetical protein
MLEALEDQLTNVRNDANLPNVIRVAAIAALEVVGKYYALTDECEVYRIAISVSRYCLWSSTDYFSVSNVPGQEDGMVPPKSRLASQ